MRRHLLPWSHVRLRFSAPGRSAIRLVRASLRCSALLPWGRCKSVTKRVLRSQGSNGRRQVRAAQQVTFGGLVRLGPLPPLAGRSHHAGHLPIMGRSPLRLPVGAARQTGAQPPAQPCPGQGPSNRFVTDPHARSVRVGPAQLLGDLLRRPEPGASTPPWYATERSWPASQGAGVSPAVEPVRQPARRDRFSCHRSPEPPGSSRAPGEAFERSPSKLLGSGSD